MSELAACAPAKCNLFLHVLGRRPDGYHEIQSLIIFLSVGDHISVEWHPDALHVETTSALDVARGAALLPTEEDNLVTQAARWLRECYGVQAGARIRMHKTIPIGAGLGGGSSDAATALKLLCTLWNLPLSLLYTPDIQHKLAHHVGADVPVCLHAPSACLVSGIGQACEPVDLILPSLWMLCVMPPASLSAGAVYGALRSYSSTPLYTRQDIPSQEPSAALAWLLRQRNDLEAPAKRLVSELSDVLASLAQQPGCLMARMSGSGTVCVGWFESEALQRQAEAQLRQQSPHWWVLPCIQAASDLAYPCARGTG